MANLIIVCGPQAVGKMMVADMVIREFKLAVKDRKEKEYRFGV